MSLLRYGNGFCCQPALGVITAFATVWIPAACAATRGFVTPVAAACAPVRVPAACTATRGFLTLVVTVCTAARILLTLIVFAVTRILIVFVFTWIWLVTRLQCAGNHHTV